MLTITIGSGAAGIDKARTPAVGPLCQRLAEFEIVFDQIGGIGFGRAGAGAKMQHRIKAVIIKKATFEFFEKVALFAIISEFQVSEIFPFSPLPPVDHKNIIDTTLIQAPDESRTNKPAPPVTSIFIFTSKQIFYQLENAWLHGTLCEMPEHWQSSFIRHIPFVIAYRACLLEISARIRALLAFSIETKDSRQAVRKPIYKAAKLEFSRILKIVMAGPAGRLNALPNRRDRAPPENHHESAKDLGTNIEGVVNHLFVTGQAGIDNVAEVFDIEILIRCALCRESGNRGPRSPIHKAWQRRRAAQGRQTTSA